MRRLLLLAMALFATEDDAWTPPRELRTTNSMRIVTWNVWFDHRRQSERLKLLLATLAKENADVIGLQEIVPDVAARIRQHAGVTARYDISENTISGYGCLLLVRRDLNPAFAELPLPTTMGRSLVAAEIDTYGHAGTRRRVVGTVHLESLDSEPTRAARRSSDKSAPSKVWTSCAAISTSMTWRPGVSGATLGENVHQLRWRITCWHWRSRSLSTRGPLSSQNTAASRSTARRTRGSAIGASACATIACSSGRVSDGLSRRSGSGRRLPRTVCSRQIIGGCALTS